MKTKLSAAFATGALLTGLMVGCVPSLNPLYTEKDLIYDPALVGTWIDADDGGATWTFQKAGDKAYHLVLKNKDGLQGEFKVHLTQLGKWRFLDMYPDAAAMEELKRDDFYKSHYIPAHTFYLVKQIEPTLQMASLEIDWLDNYLTTNTAAIGHTRVGNPGSDDRRVLFTARTEELQKFMQKMAGTEGAFADPSTMKKK